MSDYERYGKQYYLENREKILAAEKEKKRWLTYYEENKAVVAERNRRRYYEKRGLPVPEKRATKPAPAKPVNVIVYDDCFPV
jgi:hypothetical protein